MNKTSLLILGGLGLAVWYYGKLAIAGNVINVIFNGVHLKNLNTFTLSFMVQNVSNTIVSVNSMTADVFVNDSNIGNASYFGNPITILGNSQTPINVDFSLSLLGIPGALMDLISNLTIGKNDVKFQAKGTMNVNGILLPLDVKTSTIL